jgi:hypothetical protein
MKQRIKELMLSKGLHKYIDSGCQSRMEMLADLIIQDCIGIVADAVDHREPASTYVDKIKKHFGVEE